jgi:hypothetical protein
MNLNKVMNVPFAIIIASFVIILITTNMSDKNGLSALIGGYFGLLVGMMFIMILNSMFYVIRFMDYIPIVVVLTIICLLLFYLISNFDKISSGEVSSYYSTFSLLSTIFLLTQAIIIIKSVFNKQDGSNRLFSDQMFSLLGLFGTINILIVITLGIILKFYSTQG